MRITTRFSMDVAAGGVPSKSVVQMASMEGDGSGGVRDGLAKQEFRTMLNEGSTKVSSTGRKWLMT